jgi:SAM-dependent methyltransferase
MTTQGDNTFSTPIDPETMGEMARLKGQGQMLTHSLGGVLPELSRQEIARLHDVLDVACGPGEWAIALAMLENGIHVIGVDISTNVIRYAQAQAKEHNLPVDFSVLNVHQHPLPFADATFDLINARLIFAFMTPEKWPLLLSECWRIVKPGGYIRLTEPERTISNDESFEKYMSLWASTFWRDHRSFSPTPIFYGIITHLKRLLTCAGFVHIKHVLYALDISYDSPMHEPYFENVIALLQDGLPFLRRLATQEEQMELDILPKHLRTLVNNENFYGYWPLMTFVARKPPI